MKTKVFLVATIALFILFGSSVAIMAEELQKGKLGYGFEPGLVAGKDYVEGQLIVGIKEGMSTQDVIQAALASGGRVAKEEIEGAILLEFQSEKAVKNAVGILVMRPDVAFVERNGFMSIPPKPELPDLKGQKKGSSAKGDMDSLEVSTDPGTGYQWHHTVIRKTATLPTLSTTPPTVAVIDTGVDYTHPDLSGKVILGKNCVDGTNDPYDDHGHGTHVAGIIAAAAANGQYGEGVCPNCKILAVKVLGAEGWGTFYDVACGMSYARLATTTPATKVLNMSLGGSNSSLIATEVVAIKAAGKVLAASAGNGNTTSTWYAYPGADPNTALRVMATEKNDCRAWFSNFSPSATQYNIAAPGWEIPSTTPGGGYESFSGTSMASPVVAGAAALVWGQLPALTRDGLVSRIVTNGKTISCGFAVSTKRVDVSKAILGTSETAIVGRILDPFSGKSPSSPTTPTNARLFSGATQLAVDETNCGGSYEMTGLTPGTLRTLKGDRTGYVTAPLRTGIPIIGGIVQGPYTDALPKSRTTGNATITLDWKTTQPISDTSGCEDTCNGWEFDLLVKLPSGYYIDPSWNTGDLMTLPFVIAPRDSYNDLEPLETIVIGSPAADGLYKVVVDKYYSSNSSWTNSRASVQLYNGATSIGKFYANPPAACGIARYWYVGNLMKSGNVYTWTNVNTCTDTKP